MKTHLKYLLLYISAQFIMLNCVICSTIKHPCVDIKKSPTIDQEDEDMFYIVSSANKKPIKAFKNNIQYSYLYHQYMPIMKVTREIVNHDYYIKIHNNPRYYFIKGIEDLMNKNKDSANIFLSQFIDFYNLYINGDYAVRSEYFRRGCSNDDIDWIENKQNISIEYKLSINKLIYKDNLDYYLSSQILALSMFNFFEAENKFELIIDDLKNIHINKFIKKPGKLSNSKISKYTNDYLFPLMYYFEMKVTFFNVYDKKIYSFLEEIFFEMEKVKKQNFDSNYKTWLDLYSSELNYNKFKDKVFVFRDKLIDNKGSMGDDYSTEHFNKLVLNKGSNIDSIYFSKTMQYLNNRNFFFDISKVDENTYWIPEINKNLKNSLYEIEKSLHSFSFLEKSYPITKKINQAAFLFCYFYDIYINNKAQQSINYVIEPSSIKQETGIYPLIDSINGHLKSILNP